MVVRVSSTRGAQEWRRRLSRAARIPAPHRRPPVDSKRKPPAPGSRACTLGRGIEIRPGSHHPPPRRTLPVQGKTDRCRPRRHVRGSTACKRVSLNRRSDRPFDQCANSLFARTRQRRAWLQSCNAHRLGAIPAPPDLPPGPTRPSRPHQHAPPHGLPSARTSPVNNAGRKLQSARPGDQTPSRTRRDATNSTRESHRRISAQPRASAIRRD